MARIGAPVEMGFWLASRCIREWWFFDPHLLQVYCCFLKAKQSIFLCPTRRQYEHKLPFITALNLSFGGTVGLVHDFVGCDLDLQSTHSCVDASFFFSFCGFFFETMCTLSLCLKFCLSIGLFEPHPLAMSAISRDLQDCSMAANSPSIVVASDSSPLTLSSIVTSLGNFKRTRASMIDSEVNAVGSICRRFAVIALSSSILLRRFFAVLSSTEVHPYTQPTSSNTD